MITSCVNDLNSVDISDNLCTENCCTINTTGLNNKHDIKKGLNEESTVLPL